MPFSYFKDLFKILGHFLFPQSLEIASLEALPSHKLLETLPPASINIPDALAVFDYKNPKVKTLVWEIKYHGNRKLCNSAGAILYDVIYSELMDKNVFEKYGKVVLLPIPLSPERRFERGFNQTELIAKSIKNLDKEGKLEYLPNELAKIRHTGSQTHARSKDERQENLKDSMRVLDQEKIRNKFVVLVDDVITTGSTMNEAKRALKEARAKEILFAALAH